MKLLWIIIAVAVAAFLYFVRRGRGDAINAQVQRQVAEMKRSIDQRNKR